MRQSPGKMNMKQDARFPVYWITMPTLGTETATASAALVQRHVTAVYATHPSAQRFARSPPQRAALRASSDSTTDRAQKCRMAYVTSTLNATATRAPATAQSTAMYCERPSCVAPAPPDPPEVRRGPRRVVLAKLSRISWCVGCACGVCVCGNECVCARKQEREGEAARVSARAAARA
jgi:hypothetical protein